MEIIKVNLVRVIRVVMEFITVINTMFIYTLQEKNALSLLITSHYNQYLQGRLKINNWGGGGGGGHIFKYLCYAQIIPFAIEIKILKLTVFTVCEQ